MDVRLRRLPSDGTGYRGPWAQAITGYERVLSTRALFSMPLLLQRGSGVAGVAFLNGMAPRGDDVRMVL